MKVRAKIFTEQSVYTYPEAVIKHAVKKFMDRNDHLAYDGNIPQLSHAVGVVENIEHKPDDGFYADIEITSTPSGKTIQDLISQNVKLKYVPFGIGWSKEGEIIDYEMQGISIVPDYEDTTPDDTDAHH